MKPSRIHFRAFGRSGIRVSEIGMGGQREGVEIRDRLEQTARVFRSDQDRAKSVGRALESGVTYFDTTYYCELESLGRSFHLITNHPSI